MYGASCCFLEPGEPKALRAEGPAHSHPASQVAGAGTALSRLTFPDSFQSLSCKVGQSP